MVCKTTFTRRRAFTLVEFMISLAVGSLIFLAVGVLGIYAGRTFAGLVNYAELDANSRNALDYLTRDVRGVKRLASSTSTTLTFVESDGTQLQYVYSPDAKTLTRIEGTKSKVLLTGCDSLSFSIYQRNPIAGTYNQFPAGSASTAKLINVTWSCSRDILGTKMNTENVQTAKVVIRQQ